MSKSIGRGNQLYQGYGSPYSQANSNNHINNKKAYYQQPHENIDEIQFYPSSSSRICPGLSSP